MADCVCLPNCPFFHDRMSNMPAMADLFKRNYCLGQCTPCARYQVYSQFGPGSVPDDLFPNDQAGASAYISERLAEASTAQ